ncbi:AAA family ATPase [Microaceticoccus formicicus]|uniref:AAA family ATPase n=1 Tax=Microaceticoccus formicicus TaxID=3118105 RepID=UPI003CD009A0|nr:AAA family ATPase [Peptoniphilaceae bacterium AMB_02]
MLNEIFISNFAIIERTCANFENGLNIITGETGAGKSIIIEAVELLLGARANKDLIGSYSDSAVVEGVFNLSENIRTRLHEEFGIEVLEDFVIVTREIYKNGKSIARINGRQTNLSTIKDIMSSVIDIHSQHSSQILLDKKNYIEIIDSLADDKFDEELSKLDLLLSNKREILREIDKLDIDPSETQRRIDVLQYQISEISSFHLDNLNFDEVVIEHRKLSNSHDISKSMQKIKSFFLSEGYDSKDISSLVSSSIGELNSILKYDDSLNSILKQLVDLESIVNDLKFEIIDYHDSLSDNEERLFELDSIITSIENLKRKYGDSIEKILSFEQEARKELDSYQKKDENLINLKLLLKDIENKIHTKAKHISDIRKANASKV